MGVTPDGRSAHHFYFREWILEGALNLTKTLIVEENGSDARSEHRMAEIYNDTLCNTPMKGRTLVLGARSFRPKMQPKTALSVVAPVVNVHTA